MAKLHPSSRKLSLFGENSLKAIELIAFITNKQILVKMKGQYWCIVDTTGQIRALPQKLEAQLEKQNYNQITTRFMHMRGTLLLILISAKNIDVVELSHRGEVREIKEFEVIQKPAQSSENILADSNGQVYRIQHCK